MELKQNDTGDAPMPFVNCLLMNFYLKGVFPLSGVQFKIGGVAIGEPDSNELARNSVININFFLSHRSEVLAMKEQVQMIKGLLAA